MRITLIILAIFLFSCKPVKYTWNEQLFDVKYLPVTYEQDTIMIQRYKANSDYPYTLQKEIEMMRSIYYVIIDKKCRYADMQLIKFFGGIVKY